MKISYHLPAAILNNSEFAQFGWPADKIFEKTGIKKRHIAGPDEFALDLAYAAGTTLFQEYDIAPSSVDYLLYCTQSPDFIVPNNSSILHERLGLRTDTGTIDLNQGCTGFLYGLSLAKGLLVSNQARNILLVTADTWSKYIHERDKSTRSIFGDGAAATYITEQDSLRIGDFVFGTNGSGAHDIMVKTSGLRHRRGTVPLREFVDDSENVRTDDTLFMNGPDVFSFTLSHVPKMVQMVLQKANLSKQDIDHFVFHQANGYMLEHLRKKIGIPRERFHVYLEEVGNTVSSTIPIVLKNLYRTSVIQENQKILLAGFGVGYSWIATIIKT
jgi:3-oxoacyl-[acyl-carrier-protein] synthase III